MLISECMDAMAGVAKAFQRKVDDETITQYYNRFSHLSAKQWNQLCDWAVTNCDRFPTVKDLYGEMYAENMIARQSMRERDKDTFVIVCSCGSSVAFNRTVGPMLVHCADCSTSWDKFLAIRMADQYGVFWVDEDTRAALMSKIPMKQALEHIHVLLSSMKVEDKKQRVDSKVSRARLLPKEAIA